ncbi:hypothetical protein CWI37_1125p0010 [Hamiltosporidium tvaerminnensis]|uniref:Uncharacterized protein n=1 Tax=Hamiltosporidium tvaerminnensis TaxID=1176355 RepID=A0A4Q9KYH2_9MICR|nr:hypothetical protein CWI37_1125p0010 [Hamiltosporidium tvaerminnensis]
MFKTEDYTIFYSGNQIFYTLGTNFTIINNFMQTVKDLNELMKESVEYGWNIFFLLNDNTIYKFSAEEINVMDNENLQDLLEVYHNKIPKNDKQWNW